MYRKDTTEGWLKHADFIVLDMICLQIAFIIAYALSGHGFVPYDSLTYRNMAIFLELTNVVVLFLNGTLRNVLK